MLKRILSFIAGLILGKKPGSIKPGKVVVSTAIITKNGKRYKRIQYSDGSVTEVPYSASDPSGINDFLDDINN